MYSRLLLLALAAASLAAAPLHAQRERLAPGCKRERVRAPGRDQRSASERERDSTQQVIRAAILEDARATARAAGIAAPEGLLLVTFEGQAPADAAFHGWRSNVPDNVFSSVRQRALPRLAAWPGRELSVVLSMRLDSVGPWPAGTPGILVECVPLLDNREEINRLLTEFSGENEELLRAQPSRLTTRVRMLLTREGEVAYSLVDASSGQRSVDLYALQLTRRMRFRPASVNGQAVDLWIMLPLTMAAAPSTGRRAP
jgi:TonB family protein